MKFTTDEYTQVYEAPATVYGIGCGFTPEHYVGLGADTIAGIMKNAKPFPVNGFDDYESIESNIELKIEEQIENINSSEDLINFVKNNNGTTSLDINFYDIFIERLKEKTPKLSGNSFEQVMKILFGISLLKIDSEKKYNDTICFGNDPDDVFHIFDYNGYLQDNQISNKTYKKQKSDYEDCIYLDEGDF